MEKVEFNGWKNCVRLANKDVELLITSDVGPRIVRFGFIGKRNMFAELDGQQGGSGEDEWMIRGGHRFWIAPEDKPKTYELDNGPVEIVEIDGGVRTVQTVGPLSGVQKCMDITLAEKKNSVSVVHQLTNKGDASVDLSPWALTVMAQKGTAIIPQPAKIAHTARLTHTHEWSLWGYTDLSDARWTLGSKYILFRQDPSRSPNKLGIAHREGWVGYVLDGNLFVKRFAWKEGETYPDGGVNFETFSNEDFLEVESLGPMATLEPGASLTHEEEWSLHSGVGDCQNDEDVDAQVMPHIG